MLQLRRPDSTQPALGCAGCSIMDTRPPPFQAHPRPSSRSHDFPQYNVPPSPYNPDGPRNIPPPPPPALHQDPFLRPQRQTFESIAASTPRPDTRQAPSYPPPPPPYTAPADAYYRDAHDRPPEAREGYGIKRSHDQAMAGDHSEPGRPGRLHPLFFVLWQRADWLGMTSDGILRSRAVLGVIGTTCCARYLC